MTTYTLGVVYAIFACIWCSGESMRFFPRFMLHFYEGVDPHFPYGRWEIDSYGGFKKYPKGMFDNGLHKGFLALFLDRADFSCLDGRGFSEDGCTDYY